MAKFKNIQYSVGQDSEPGGQERLRTLDRKAADQARESRIPSEVAAGLAKAKDETAGRMYLQTFLEDAGSETMLEITSPNRAELVPDMRLESTASVPALQANSVVFHQSAHDIPIFGGRIVVDIDSADKALVSINGKVTPLPGTIEPFSTVSAHDAFARLAAWGGHGQQWIDAATRSLKPPVLTWFLDEETEAWHLVHHFASIPMKPKADESAGAAHAFPSMSAVCLGCSPRSESAAYDYFVDAHNGEVVFYFSSNPHLTIPAPMMGQDHNGNVRNFFGFNGGAYFALSDPLRNIETFDYANNDLDAVPTPNFPANAIQHSSNDLANAFPAAVSAHYHAQVVWDFFNDVLKRDSVDDRGMKLVSVVNVYSSNQNSLPPPDWRNAVWWDNKMWYGQVNKVSLAKHLDVIAHELTHGVTQSSSNLIYRRLSGALNESYSDIFGVIVANWYPAGPQPINAWTWSIGSGLGSGGGPLRDFSNPAATGHPDHFSQYVVLPLSQDEGGVHIYSGIHNKAIYSLLTGTDATGQFTFPVTEATLLLYLTLTRLTPTSDFADSRRTLENVTRTYYASDPAAMAVRLAAIAAAFGAAGL